MIAPIDDRIRTFHKGLFTSDLFGYEDPTYLGFTFHFEFNPVHVDLETGQCENPLFATRGSGINSAQHYLQQIGFKQRFKMLREFKRILEYMNKNAPYFFQGISGVAELWKIDKKSKGFEPNRGFEKVLKIDCLESIDLRMTAFADLYRQATFDGKYMRELLPENLRWFTMTLRIAEIRKFHSVSKLLKSSILEKRIDEKPTGDDLKVLDDLISVIEFDLGHCEFDFEESFGDEFKMNGDTEMATQSFKIKVGTIRQKSTYKLLDIALTDFYSSTSEGTVERSDVIGGKFTGTSQNAENDRAVLEDIPLGSRVPGMDDAVNPNNLFNGATSALTSKVQGFGNQLSNLGGNLIGNALGGLQSKITGMALGNVYDVTNRTLLESINGFLGGGDKIGLALNIGEKDVYPGAPGIDTTTKTTKNLGNAYNNDNPTVPPINLGNVYL